MFCGFKCNVSPGPAPPLLPLKPARGLPAGPEFTCSCVRRGSHSAATTPFPPPTGRPQPAEPRPLPSAHVRSSCYSASARHSGPCGPSAQATQTLAGGLSDKSHCTSREGCTCHGGWGGGVLLTADVTRWAAHPNSVDLSPCLSLSVSPYISPLSLPTFLLCLSLSVCSVSPPSPSVCLSLCVFLCLLLSLSISPLSLPLSPSVSLTPPISSSLSLPLYLSSALMFCG